MTISERFLLIMTVIVALPWLIWRPTGVARWVPLVVVQIVVGVLLGPGVLGAIDPSVWHAMFNGPVLGALNGVAWWSVMLFVWATGVELDLAGAWEDRHDTAVSAAFALGLPLLLGSAAGALLIGWHPEWVGTAGRTWQAIAGIGMACAVTALPILVLLIERLGLADDPLGWRAMRYASLDDVAIWLILSLILLDWSRIGLQLAFLAAFAIGSAAIRRLVPKLAPSDRWPFAIIVLACSAFAADWCGLHLMVGAFLAGTIMDRGWFGEEQLRQFRELLLVAFMPTFFLNTGLRTQWALNDAAPLAAALLLLGASVGGKLLGVSIAGSILGWKREDTKVIGWLLQTKALVMIIFVGVLLDERLISNALFAALLLMAVLSTILTIPAVERLRRGKDLLS